MSNRTPQNRSFRPVSLAFLILAALLAAAACSPSGQDTASSSHSQAQKTGALFLESGYSAARALAKKTGGFAMSGTASFEGKKHKITVSFSLRMSDDGAFEASQKTTDCIGDTESFRAVYTPQVKKLCVAEGPRPYVCTTDPERVSLDYIVNTVWRTWSDAVEFLGLTPEACKNGCRAEAGTLEVEKHIPKKVVISTSYKDLFVKLNASLTPGPQKISLPPKNRIYGDATRRRILMDRKFILGDHRPAPLRYMYPK